MFYTYVLQSINNPSQTYIGFTQNLNQRLKQHNSQQSPHTAKYIPWKIIFFAAFNSQDKAILFEKYLKTGSGRRFLINHCFSD